jgi:hypothetical protein
LGDGGIWVNVQHLHGDRRVLPEVDWNYPNLDFHEFRCVLGRLVAVRHLSQFVQLSSQWFLDLLWHGKSNVTRPEQQGITADEEKSAAKEDTKKIGGGLGLSEKASATG